MIPKRIENKHKDFKGEQKISIKIIKGFCYFELNKMYELEDLLKIIDIDFHGKYEIEASLYARFYKLSTQNRINVIEMLKIQIASERNDSL